MTLIHVFRLSFRKFLNDIIRNEIRIVVAFVHLECVTANDHHYFYLYTGKHQAKYIYYTKS